MAEQHASPHWWAVSIDVWEQGAARQLKSHHDAIPETERVQAQGQPRPPIEVEAVVNVKYAAIRGQSLLLRQLLARDRWFATFAPEVPFAKRYAQIAKEHDLTLVQVMRALELAHSMADSGLL